MKAFPYPWHQFLNTQFDPKPKGKKEHLPRKNFAQITSDPHPHTTNSGKFDFFLDAKNNVLALQNQVTAITIIIIIIVIFFMIMVMKMAKK